MREVASNPAVARDKGRRGRDHILAHFTWEQSVDKVLARLEALAGTAPRRLGPR
ncbi:hypothetical protein D3C87_2141000 [compost metagenome]